ncbi:hypothetical protein DSECCO2_609880 [anaerobic digester metagenome]|nr:hypothetical protein [Lentimicrobiaceae bacterium]
MKIAVIRFLAETHSLDVLENAEAAFYDEKVPEIEVPGDDEGEQLTHVIAALEILREMEETQCALNVALRNYTQRVRNSIS